MDGETLLWFSGLAGTGVFAIQFLLLLLGFSALEDFNDGLVDGIQIKWLSKQALAAFFMMFGWAGLCFYKQFGLPFYLATLLAIAVGILAMTALYWLFRFAIYLQSSGTIFSIQETIGKEAKVYQRIPAQGIGKITVVVDGFTREVDAASEKMEEIPSFTRVQVVRLIDHTCVAVKIIP